MEIGPVKNAGAYKHTPGMTVLHTLALAGGLDRGQNQAWQLVDTARETDKRETTVERTKRLLVKRAVLVAERDGTPLVVAKELRELAGDGEVKELIASEMRMRELTLSAFNLRRKALQSAIDLARNDIETQSRRIPPIKSSLRSEGAIPTGIRGPPVGEAIRGNPLPEVSGARRIH